MTEDALYFCQDEGLCCHCGRSIVWGVDAVYTINGAHYDCQFPNGRKEFTPLPVLLDKPRAQRVTDSKPRLARANGGHLLHWVVGYTSLCGHTPQNRTKCMRTRGKWLFIPNNTNITGRVLCPKCESAHAQL